MEKSLQFNQTPESECLSFKNLITVQKNWPKEQRTLMSPSSMFTLHLTNEFI